MLLRRLVVMLAGVLALAALSGCQSAEDQAIAYYKRGERLVAEGEPVKAALEFRNALRLREDMVEAVFALGEVELSQRRYDDALRLYLTAAERDPNHIASRVRLAYFFLGADQIKQASRFADQAFAKAGTDPSVLVAKAAIALKLGKRDEAVRLSEAALERDPDNTDAVVVLASERLVAADARGALEFLDRSLERNERSLDLQFLKLTALESIGDQPAIEAVLTRLTDLYPEIPAFRESLANWYVSKRRVSDAEAVLRRYADANPDDVPAHLSLVAFIKAQKGAASAADELTALIERGDSPFAYQLAMAELYSAQGRRDDAFDLLTKLAADAPDDRDRDRARIQLARMNVVIGDWAEAERLADAILEGDATNIDALGIRASARFANGQEANATADLIAALNEAPDSVPLLWALGNAYERAGSVELAEEQYIKVLRLTRYAPPQALEVAQFFLRYGKTEQAERILVKAGEQAAKDRGVLALLAELRLARRDWSGAQEIAGAIRTLGDNNDGADTSADAIVAAALSGQGRHDESIDVLRTSIARDGDKVRLGSLVRAYVQAGKVADAEELLTSAAASDPADVRIRILLSSIYASTGRKDQAEETLKRVVAEDAGSADAGSALGYAALAELYSSMGRLDEAEATARAGLAAHAADNDLKLLLALILERSGRYEEAIALYEAMFTSDPRSTTVANNLASLLSEQRSDAASLERAFTIALRFRNSEVPQFLDTLGWIYYLRGAYPSSLAVLKTAAEKLPDNSAVQYHLGMVLKALGQSDLAIASLEKAISLGSAANRAPLSAARSALEQLQPAKQPTGDQVRTKG